MKISLIGYGKMGKLIEQCALAKGHSIIAKIDSKTSSWPEQVVESDILIDFSTPECALKNIKKAADLKINIVMGTTGWDEHIEEARVVVKKADIGCLYAPNFSLGVALFLNIIAQAASIIAPFAEYDVSGVEIHHNQKLDSPSGTAKKIINQLSEHLACDSNKIHFASVRVGSVPGTHTVIFDSPADTITLTHTARNREGFVEGALSAAEWLLNKKGFFTLDDMLLAKNQFSRK